MEQQQATRPNTGQAVVDNDSNDDDGDDDDVVDGHHSDYMCFPFSAYDYPICIHDYSRCMAALHKAVTSAQ